MPGQQEEHRQSQGIVEDTATPATTTVRAMHQCATSTVRASLRSAILAATLEWLRDDGHLWLPLWAYVNTIRILHETKRRVHYY